MTEQCVEISLPETIEQILLENCFSFTHEKREHRRFSLAVAALAQPVDEDLEPIGDAVPVITRDISDGGISFFAPRLLPSQSVCLKIRVPSGKEYWLFAEPVRTRPLGFAYEIGCQFRTPQ